MTRTTKLLSTNAPLFPVFRREQGRVGYSGGFPAIRASFSARLSRLISHSRRSAAGLSSAASR
jgi:hypothetical protein